jgi:SAM-dependent methyltransferase
MQTLTDRLKMIKKRVVSRFVYALDPQRIYGKETFYTTTRKGKGASIEVAANLILEAFQPKEVVDIGCGEGLFLNVLHQNGVNVLGCDISEAALKVSAKDFVIFQADATKPVRFNKTFDLCICVEIAEHIPTRYSKTLVQNVTRASDTIFFTAAPPWQGGVGHINEQLPEFWIKLFEAEGYQLEEALTESLKHRMEAADVVFWLSQNLMIFTRKR